MQRDLFLCFTPLQVLIAKSIILSNDYEGGEPDLYLFALSDSVKYRYYFEDVFSLCHYAEFVAKLPRFPFYIPWIWRRFKSKNYRNIYSASIDSVHVQYILSICSFKKIRTFDDGTANIDKLSLYHLDAPSLFERTKRLMRWLTGNYYTSKIISKNSEVHYTIYPGFYNITNNIKRIDLFSHRSEEGNLIKKNSANVFLGTVFNELCSEKSKVEALVFMIKDYFVSSRPSCMFYIRHPRDSSSYFQDFNELTSPLLAEEIIINLLNSYQTVVVFGFASSAQFNLISRDKIKNVVFLASQLPDNYRDLANMLATHGAEQISLD